MNTNTDKPILVLNAKDNVGVARLPISEGREIVVNEQNDKVSARETILPGHKLALRPIAKGSLIHKYGETIGKATEDIAAGAWVHTHNVAPEFNAGHYEFATQSPVTKYFSPEEAGEFLGYARENGDVGTRNYVAVIATSNCSSHVTELIAEHFSKTDFASDGPNGGVDGVVAIPHQEGCGHSQGEDTWQLERTIAGMIYHPNVGAVLMVSLGCEV
ncbi:MAG: UxaA family hydrolase, partial [Acidobacteria bacterium]|nr:UxaA family hydrolase [Acidobacteriota bacterium]